MILALNHLLPSNGNNMRIIVDTLKKRCSFFLSIVVLLFVLIAPSTMAQPEGAVKKTIDGKQYYIHKVQGGNTLYSIARAYSIDEKHIIKENPGSDTAIKIGQELKIPADKIDQEEAKVAPIIEGEHLIHLVKKGETAFGIARKYNVSLNDLLALNPESSNGLKIGQGLRIPVDKVKDKAATIQPAQQQNITANHLTTQVQHKDSVVNDVTSNNQEDEDFIIHLVVEGETLYALSRKYGVSEEEITTTNAGLTDGLKVGTELRIPKVNNNVDNHTVIASDSAFWWLNDTSVVTKEVYNVAILLPFYLYKNEQMDAVRKPIDPIEIYGPSMLSLEFYHGALIALDSLKRQGLSVNLFVYDTAKDTAKVKKILQKAELKKVDLFIGPLYKSTFKLVADYARKTGAHVVCPVPQSNKLLLGNPHVSKVTSSTPTKMKFLAEYLAEQYHAENVIMMDSRKKKDNYSREIFKKHFNKSLLSYQGKYRDTIMVSTMEKYTIKSLTSQLRQDKVNVIVVPSTDLAYVSDFINRLSGLDEKKYKDYKIILFGEEKWLNYDNIDVDTKLRFNLHLVASSMIDFEAPSTTNFINKYRASYKTDPGKYGVLGFDVAYYYLMGLRQFGVSFPNYFDRIGAMPIHTNFSYRKMGLEGGYENKNVYVVKYADYSLVKVK